MPKMTLTKAQREQVTPFRAKVFDALLRVPKGRVTTYARLGAMIGCASPRAIGQALRNNPFAPEIPCHRVIAGDLTIGGFNGTKMGAPIKKKLKLLEAEGVVFFGGELADKTKVYEV